MSASSLRQDHRTTYFTSGPKMTDQLVSSTSLTYPIVDYESVLR